MSLFESQGEHETVPADGLDRFGPDTEITLEQERGGRGGFRRAPASRLPAPRHGRGTAWQRTRWRSPRSFGSRFWRDYINRRHRRHRRPGFNGWVGDVDGLPMYYRRSLWGGMVVDEPPATMPPQEDPAIDSEPAEPTEPQTDAAASAAEPTEEEITRSFSATLDWSTPVALSGALKRSDGGIYVVEKDGVPIYVGEAASFARRWLVRLEVLRQLALSSSPYTLRLARIAAANAPFNGAAGSRLRESIEHTVIRGLARQGIRLTNRTSIRPFVVGSIALTHTGTRPRYILNSPAPVSGQSYENFGFA